MDVPVACYAGGRYPERPRAFSWEGKQLEVEEIERQWRTPDRLVFHVRTADGRRFALTYREAADAWNIHPRLLVEEDDP